MSRETDRDFKLLATMKVPVKRAAYSDRSAWVMAILSELAYTPYDEESKQQLLELAATLAQLTDQNEIAEKLEALQKVLAGTAPAPGGQSNAVLKAALAAGGFELAGGAPLHNAATDTQGFVAVRPDKQGTGLGMAVICFRGTKQIKDWITDVDIAAAPVHDETTNAVLGNMHKGFHDAYMSVHDDIAARLAGYEDLPLYITGHSLGGALAVVATWYQSSDRLAACYTFGAPRVGDQALIDRFKTPIYRVVNAADPVPLVPPSGFSIEAGKMVLRALGSLFPAWGAIDWMVDRLIKVQKFRHYGYMRYLTDADPGDGGNYPGMRVEFSVSNTRRLISYVMRWREGTGKRIDRYHDMSQYRGKLGAYATRCNTP